MTFADCCPERAVHSFIRIHTCPRPRTSRSPADPRCTGHARDTLRPETCSLSLSEIQIYHLAASALGEEGAERDHVQCTDSGAAVRAALWWPAGRPGTPGHRQQSRVRAPEKSRLGLPRRLTGTGSEGWSGRRGCRGSLGRGQAVHPTGPWPPIPATPGPFCPPLPGLDFSFSRAPLCPGDPSPRTREVCRAAGRGVLRNEHPPRRSAPPPATLTGCRARPPAPHASGGTVPGAACRSFAPDVKTRFSS